MKMAEDRKTYTIYELKAHDEGAYDRALQRIRGYYYYDSTITDEYEDWFQEGIAAPLGIEFDKGSFAYDEYGVSASWDIEDRGKLLNFWVSEFGLCKNLERRAALLLHGIKEISFDTSLRSHSVLCQYASLQEDCYLIAGREHPDDWLDDFVRYVHDHLCAAMSRYVRADEEYRTSDEYLAEMADANELAFDEEGSLI